MNHARRRRSSLLLVLLCAALASVVYWELNHAPPLTGDRTVETLPAPDVQSRAEEPEFAMPPREAYAEIVARPLFSPSRRPPPSQEAEPEIVAAEPTPSRFILTGVVILADERLVLLQRAGAAGIIRASEGEEIDGWRVEAIGPDRVVLRNGDTVEEITLEDAFQPVPVQGRLRIRKGRRRDDGAQ